MIRLAVALLILAVFLVGSCCCAVEPDAGIVVDDFSVTMGIRSINWGLNIQLTYLSDHLFEALAECGASGGQEKEIVKGRKAFWIIAGGIIGSRGGGRASNLELNELELIQGNRRYPLIDDYLVYDYKTGKYVKSSRVKFPALRDGQSVLIGLSFVPKTFNSYEVFKIKYGKRTTSVFIPWYVKKQLEGLKLEREILGELKDGILQGTKSGSLLEVNRQIREVDSKIDELEGLLGGE